MQKYIVKHTQTYREAYREKKKSVREQRFLENIRRQTRLWPYAQKLLQRSGFVFGFRDPLWGLAGSMS